MRYHLDVLEEVYEELEEAGDYYYSQRSGLEMELFKDWEQTLERILKSPEGYQKKAKNFRHALLERFPYLIIFEIIDSAVVVFRFINARKHPKKRYRRRK